VFPNEVLSSQNVGVMGTTLCASVRHTDARYSQAAQGIKKDRSETGSCHRKRRRTVVNRREVPRSIETRNKARACMVYRWNKTK
jgi:hypothetical protein